ncbi:MAG: hypothetical protein ACR2J8_10895 [Thermomicrobiales bacterium]
MLDSYRELIDELLGAPQAIRKMIALKAMTPEAARLVTEMRNRDGQVLDRLNIILRTPDPRLPELVAGDPAVPDSVDDLLTQTDSARGDLVSLLMNLTIKDWERPAVLGDEGETTLSEEVERHVDFDEAQLARIRAALGA